MNRGAFRVGIEDNIEIRPLLSLRSVKFEVVIQSSRCSQVGTGHAEEFVLYCEAETIFATDFKDWSARADAKHWNTCEYVSFGDDILCGSIDGGFIPRAAQRTIVLLVPVWKLVVRQLTHRTVVFVDV